MTRVEVFVDATLAFAGTILVKSINQIPCSVTELLVISKYKAVCILGAAQLVFIWHNHTISSKRIGLEGGKTVFSQWLGFWAILILSDGYPHDFTCMLLWPARVFIQEYRQLKFVHQ